MEIEEEHPLDDIQVEVDEEDDDNLMMMQSSLQSLSGGPLRAASRRAVLPVREGPPPADARLVKDVTPLPRAPCLEMPCVELYLNASGSHRTLEVPSSSRSSDLCTPGDARSDGALPRARLREPPSNDQLDAKYRKLNYQHDV